jgi:hypothetical protein
MLALQVRSNARHSIDCEVRGEPCNTRAGKDMQRFCLRRKGVALSYIVRSE